MNSEIIIQSDIKDSDTDSEVAGEGVYTYGKGEEGVGPLIIRRSQRQEQQRRPGQRRR